MEELREDLDLVRLEVLEATRSVFLTGMRTLTSPLKMM